MTAQRHLAQMAQQQRDHKDTAHRRLDSPTKSQTVVNRSKGLRRCPVKQSTEVPTSCSMRHQPRDFQLLKSHTLVRSSSGPLCQQGSARKALRKSPTISVIHLPCREVGQGGACDQEDLLGFIVWSAQMGQNKSRSEASCVSAPPIR